MRIRKYGDVEIEIDDTQKITRKNLEDLNVRIEIENNDIKVYQNDQLLKLKYNEQFYKNVSIKGLSYSIGLHRLVYVWYNGELDLNLEVDHIDSNPTNCLPENLQAITKDENLAKRNMFGGRPRYGREIMSPAVEQLINKLKEEKKKYNWRTKEARSLSDDIDSLQFYQWLLCVSTCWQKQYKPQMIKGKEVVKKYADFMKPIIEKLESEFKYFK